VWCPEEQSLPRYFTMREEELFEIGAVSFKRLVTLLRQGIEGMLEDVVLVEVRSISARVSTIHVVDSPAESAKCVCTQNEQELEPSAQNKANQILWFGKPESLVLSGLAAVRGTVDSSEGVLLPGKWRLTRWER
jgi:hypothetical protein